MIRIIKFQDNDGYSYNYTVLSTENLSFVASLATHYTVSLATIHKYSMHSCVGTGLQIIITDTNTNKILNKLGQASMSGLVF